MSPLRDGGAPLCLTKPVEELSVAFRAIAADLARNDCVGAYDESRKSTVFESSLHAYADEVGMIPDGDEISTQLVDSSLIVDRGESPSPQIPKAAVRRKSHRVRQIGA